MRRAPRAIGFDDGPIARGGQGVGLFGAVCWGTRFEGLVVGRIRRDGWNVTDEIIRLLHGGKFLRQLHWVLLDGATFGGFNVVDLPRLSRDLERPCVAVMRRPPNLMAVRRALEQVTKPALRWEMLERAGPIHVRGGFVFQCQGATPDETAAALSAFTDIGAVPECLRLAHLIGAAVASGESGRRA